LVERVRVELSEKDLPVLMPHCVDPRAQIDEMLSRSFHPLESAS
jgi:hypothetical protein